jgi:hypothetical protein
MLPDFAPMIGQRTIPSQDPSVAAGVAFHYETDAVFHDSATFVDLQRQARAALSKAGLARGPRLAAAHVGLELMLDAELARVRDNFNHYLHALSVVRVEAARGLPTACDASAVWRDLESLAELLLERANRLAPSDPGELYLRLERVLHFRPALALLPSDEAPIVEWASIAWPEVVRRLPVWLSELQGGLRLPVTPANVSSNSGESKGMVVRT